MFSNMQAILANLVVPVVRLLLFIAAYAAIKFIQTKAAIYKAKKGSENSGPRTRCSYQAR